MQHKEINDAAAWLDAQIGQMKYGEVSVKAVIHDGVVKYVERQIVEKTKSEQ